jgi:hypothetical protein
MCSEGPGPAKQIDRPPPATFAKSQTHPPAGLFFPCLFFLVPFWAFLGKGLPKHHTKFFCKKYMSKTFPKKIDKSFDVSFSSTFLVLSRFWVFRSNEIVSKRFHKKIDNKKVSR